MNTITAMELAALNERSDYRVCREDTDPRGWRVLDAAGVLLGTADDLIIDVDALIARYIVCSVARGAARSVLIPIGFARLDDQLKTVHLDFVTAADIETLPAYAGLPISATHTAQIEKMLTGVEREASQNAKIVRRETETGDTIPGYQA